jgi:glycosyltransferase involved in cell wall biosynthesis
VSISGAFPEGFLLGSVIGLTEVAPERVMLGQARRSREERDLNLLILLEGVRPGGAEQDVLRLARGLGARGHRVVIGATGEPMLDLARRNGEEALALRGTGGLRSIVRTCRERRIDLVNAHSIRMTFLAGIGVRTGLIRVPLVTTIHNVSERRNDWLAYPVLRLLPDRLSFVSRYEQSRLEARWGRGLGQVVHTGIDIHDPDAIEPLDLDVRHGIPAGARVIGCVGRLASEKGVEDAIGALADLPRDSVLCIVGSGPEEGALRAAASERGLAERVCFAGYSDEVLGYLRSFELLVLPSRRESLPVVLREAGMMRLPVVAADVGGVSEIVVPGETGLLYRSGDVAALTQGIRSLLDAPERARQMGERARTRVLERFSLDRWLDATEALFAELG